MQDCRDKARQNTQRIHVLIICNIKTEQTKNTRIICDSYYGYSVVKLRVSTCVCHV